MKILIYNYEGFTDPKFEKFMEEQDISLFLANSTDDIVRIIDTYHPELGIFSNSILNHKILLKKINELRFPLIVSEHKSFSSQNSSFDCISPDIDDFINYYFNKKLERNH